MNNYFKQILHHFLFFAFFTLSSTKTYKCFQFRLILSIIPSSTNIFFFYLIFLSNTILTLTIMSFTGALFMLTLIIIPTTAMFDKSINMACQAPSGFDHTNWIHYVLLLLLISIIIGAFIGVFCLCRQFWPFCSICCPNNMFMKPPTIPQTFSSPPYNYVFTPDRLSTIQPPTQLLTPLPFPGNVASHYSSLVSPIV